MVMAPEVDGKTIEDLPDEPKISFLWNMAFVQLDEIPDDSDVGKWKKITMKLNLCYLVLMRKEILILMIICLL